MEALRPKHKIIIAQENYLKTGDMKYLEDFYRNVMGLGLAIQQREELVIKDPDAVPDLASDLVLKLMERREVVIRRAPSAYLKNALFFMNKNLHHDSIEDVEISTEDSIEEPFEEVIDNLMSDVDESTEVGQLVRVTLESGINWKLVNRQLTSKRFRRKYRETLMEIRDNAKDNLQSSGVLQVGDTSEQVLCGASEPGEEGA